MLNKSLIVDINSGICEVIPFSDGFAIRHVINLKAELLIETGDGTENSPYEIKEIG